MKGWTEIPAPLKKKTVLTGLIGIGCFLVGIAFYLFGKDLIMLLLSIGVFLFSIYKAITLYLIASKGAYEIVEGVCTSIAPKLFGRYRKIKIVDEEKNERSLMIAKSSKIKVGDDCRFYFTRTEKLTIGKEQFDLPDYSDTFLGYELKNN